MQFIINKHLSVNNLSQFTYKGNDYTVKIRDIVEGDVFSKVCEIEYEGELLIYFSLWSVFGLSEKISFKAITKAIDVRIKERKKERSHLEKEVRLAESNLHTAKFILSLQQKEIK